MEYVEKIQTGQTGFEINKFRRNQRIEFQATPDEYDLLTDFALKARYGTLAAYVRETALEGIPIQGTKKTRLAERKILIRDLGNIGSNINQIAKTLNYYVLTQIVDKHDPQHILALMMASNVQEMKEDLAAIRKVLLNKKK